MSMRPMGTCRMIEMSFISIQLWQLLSLVACGNPQYGWIKTYQDGSSLALACDLVHGIRGLDGLA